MPQTEAGWRESLRRRLDWLATRHGQATLARKTGASRQNVSRYLKGRRVPLEFGAALVSGLGVNPTWLVVGEGSPLLADVSADTASTASDLLEMVRAMEAVSKRRLGELTGKDYAGKLRELNESAQSFERLRARLDEQTRPWLLQLTKELEAAIHAGRLAHARNLEQACSQLARFTHDAEALNGFLDMQGWLHHRLGNDEQALGLAQESFLRRLSLDPSNPLWGRNAHNLVVGLIAQGHALRARRIGNAALAMMGDGAAERDQFHRQLALDGIADLELGDIRAALDKVSRAAAYTNRGRYPLATTMLDFVHLVSGANELPRCMRQYLPGEIIHRRVLSFAIWTQEHDSLRIALERAGQRRDSADIVEDPYETQARRVLDTLADRRRWQRDLPGTGRNAFETVTNLADCAQLAALGGNHARARDFVSQASARITDLAPGQQPLLMSRAILFRAALDSGVRGAVRQQALDFFSTHVAAGYRCFEPVLKNAKGPA